MQFELDETLVDSILFSMEDQNDTFLVDTHEADVVSVNDLEEEEFEDDEHYISLPEWDSNDGFRLMERFAVSLKNPPVKKALSRTLDQGRGVFRAFKNILNDYPETEQLWYKFKEQAMRKHIIRWYNGLREEWGLEKIGEEPEETDDLILEDFRIRRPHEKDTIEAVKLHQLCHEEYQKFLPEEFCINLFQKNQKDWNFPHDISWVAEDIDGGFAGYILAKIEEADIKITALEVVPEYRGMGIGEALLNHVIAQIDKEKISRVLIDIPVNSESFSKVLYRNAFAPYETRYFLETQPEEK